MNTSRREFLTGTFAGIAGLVVLNSCSNSDLPTTPNPTVDQIVIDINQYSELKTSGGFIKQNVGNDFPVIVQRFDNDVFKCAYLGCRHENFQIGDPSSGTFVCSHHGSTYGDTATNFGTLVKGPATTGLVVYNNTIFDPVANTVTVKFR